MDAIARLTAAIAEARARMGGGGRRRPGKNKKVKAVARPAKGGPSAGCGTGAGGFKAGNQCAKEDGIPRKPLGQGGALKKADPKADIALAKKLREKAAAKKARKEALDKAKSEAARPHREKQKRIDALKKEAARRKAEKGERDAAEKKAAAEAAAKKRAATLQKIRIKKANERLQVVEKPPGRFSGNADQSVSKNAAETQFEFARRRIGADLNKLHGELDTLETKADALIKASKVKLQELQEEAASIVRERQAFAGKITNGSRKPTKDEVEEYDGMTARLAENRSKIREAEKAEAAIEERLRQESHDIISEFVKSHGNGAISVSAKNQFADKDALEATTSRLKDAFKQNAEKAWSFLNRTIAPVYQPKAEAITVRLDTSRGGADYNDVLQQARHGTKGRSGDYHTSDAVIVHEIAHGLHYGRYSIPADPRDKLSLPRVDQVSESIRNAIKEDYDARVAAFRAAHGGNIEQVVYHPDRQSYKLWKPRGESRRPLGESYLGYANQYADSEHATAIKATEVVSVGIEEVYRSPRKFRRLARSHFDLMMVFMSGRLH